MTPERAAQITDEIDFLRSIEWRRRGFGQKHNDEITPVATLIGYLADRAQDAFNAGVDWAYEPERLFVPVHKTRYLGEKWSRVFGPFLGSHRSEAERAAHLEMFIKSAKWLVGE